MFTLAWEYLLWHYSKAYVDIVHLLQNALWFVRHFFSVPELLQSLFTPLYRLEEKPVNIFQYPGEYFGNLVVSILMRLVGFSIRSILLLLASILWCVLIIFGILFVLLWSVLPFVVPRLFIMGIQYLFL